MFGQTIAIFVDAYRELQSRKLFWVTLALSVLVVGIFALVGIDKEGMSIAGWRIGFASSVNTDVVPADIFYKQLFIAFGIGFWLSWIATILALVSTAGMIPDLISSGSIELVLSRPLGRMRLFLTKYVAGLLFVTLQVAVFTAASFVVLGLRGGAWEPGLFIAVPVVVAFFSYLFSICALLGMITRSTIASLLLTLLAWFAFYMLHTAEATLLMFRTAESFQVEQREESLEELRATVNDLGGDASSVESPSPPEDTTATASSDDDRGQEDSGNDSSGNDNSNNDNSNNDNSNNDNSGNDHPDNDNPDNASQDRGNAQEPAGTEGPLAEAESKLAAELKLQQESQQTLSNLALAHDICYGLKTVTPKTTETIGLLERWLFDMAALQDLDDDEEQHDDVPPFAHPEVQKRLIEEFHGRSTTWVLGTSFAFEAVFLGLAGWIFCRRDF